MISFDTRGYVKVSWWTRMSCCYENVMEMEWLSTSLIDDMVMGRESIHTRYQFAGCGSVQLFVFILSRC